MKGLFKKHVQDLSEVARHGDAREESFYGTLSVVLKDYAEAKKYVTCARDNVTHKH